jgi:hypothetical protein
VRSQDPNWQTVPVAFSGWEKEMPDARWGVGIRRPEGAAQRKLPPWPLYRRGVGRSPVAAGEDTRDKGADHDATRLNAGIEVAGKSCWVCWKRLKDALGTVSSAFVEASLFQLIAAARLPDQRPEIDCSTRSAMTIGSRSFGPV